jgi:hypothetical protein
MKGIVVLCGMRTAFLLLCCCCWLAAPAQPDNRLSPAEKLRTFPPFKLLRPDSTAFMPKNELPARQPVLLMLFNPSCEHCRQTIREWKAAPGTFDKVSRLLVTTAPLPEMRDFIREFGLDAIPDLTVARDPDFNLPVFFGLSHFPYLAFYNRKKELIRTQEGSLTVEKIRAVFDR